MQKITVRDREIITKSFKLLTRGEPPSVMLESMNWGDYFNVFSSATGDNRYVNPIAQSNPGCDPRYSRMAVSKEGGMGSMYKELYDDVPSILTITPGVAQFAGLLQFISNMFDPVSAIIANKGRAPGFAFYVAQAAGSILFWPMQAISVGVQFLDFLIGQPKNSFYTVKPAMGAYTMAANGILNDCLVHLGYIDPVLNPINPQQPHPLHSQEHSYDNRTATANLRHLIPDAVNDDGTIDLMRLMLRGTRKHRMMIKKLQQLDNDVNVTTYSGKIRAQREAIQNLNIDASVEAGTPTVDFINKEMGTVSKYRSDEEGSYPEQDSAYTSKSALENVFNEEQGVNALGVVRDETGAVVSTMNDIQAGMGGSFGVGGGNDNPNDGPSINNPVTPPREEIAGGEQLYLDDDPNDRSWAGNTLDLVESAVWSGLDAISFRVEGLAGAISDSFGNSTTTSPLAEKFNSTVTAANNFKFDLAGGQTGIGVVDGIVNMLKEAGTGFLSGTVVGNIPLALANNAYLKVPDHWESSSSDLHKETYTIYCNCNYAHPYEQIMKIWTMFSLILPLVAGMSSGAGTSSSPFLVKAFSQGRTFIRTGIVDSATFTFGEGEGGWTKDRKPLNMKVELSITDLEPLVSVPVNRALSPVDMTNPASMVNRMLNDDTAYTNYLSRLTGVTYLDTILKSRRMSRMLTKASLDMKMAFSSQRMAGAISDSFVGDLMRLGVREVER